MYFMVHFITVAAEKKASLTPLLAVSKNLITRKKSKEIKMLTTPMHLMGRGLQAPNCRGIPSTIKGVAK